jgi:hypothetical protein
MACGPVSPSEATDMPNDLHDRFLKQLPRIEAHAKFAFRRVGCPHARGDLEAETIALTWREFIRLIDRGKNLDRFVTTLAMRCAQAAGGGSCEVAQAFGVCPARVSQMRRELADRWREFRAV